jgi:hypothetical protein
MSKCVWENPSTDDEYPWDACITHDCVTGDGDCPLKRCCVEADCVCEEDEE